MLQLYDIEIDRVNKPDLPLAAGDFSVATGWAIVAATGAVSLAIGAGAHGRWVPLGCRLCCPSTHQATVWRVPCRRQRCSCR